jgi:hypothetical protein
MKADMSAVATKPAAITRYSNVLRTFFRTFFGGFGRMRFGDLGGSVVALSSVEAGGVSETITQYI